MNVLRAAFLSIICCAAIFASPCAAQEAPAIPAPGISEGAPPCFLFPGDIKIDIPPLARSIKFTGNTIMTSAELLKSSGLRSGQLINEEVLDEAIEGIQFAYQERGYIAAVTAIELPNAGQVGTLTFHITELRVAGVRFDGLSKVRDAAVRRVLSIKQGDIFSRDALTRDYIQLQQLGVFENISSSMEPTQQVGEAVVVWKFNERQQFNYAEMGGSYSPQDSLVGTLDLTFDNLGGYAQRLLVSGMIGSVESQGGGRIEYYNPWIAPENTSLKASIFSIPRYRFSESLTGASGRYFERHSGLVSAVSRMVDPSLQMTAGLRYENVEVNNLPSGDLTNTTVQSGTIMLASLRGEHDLRNSIIRPTSGVYTIGQVEAGYSNQDSGGGSGVGKLWADRRWYLPMRKQAVQQGVVQDEVAPVLAMRTLLAVSAGSLPYYEQYFVGGVGDLPLRGYLEGRFWGKYAMLASAEIRYPFTKEISGVAFADIGDAWASDFQYVYGVSTGFEQTKKFSPRAGAGIGLRYYSSVGLMRLDFAYGDAFRTYFSVGQSF
ncbi:MAG: BamA/TamA family outer membrane protein [Armatimonadota bacterium]|nr:BamA/TamA family outer membrane protein [bacterium]